MSMISGAHSIIYSKNPEADRAFMRDVLKLPHIDSGDGWLIFALPPSEVAFHDSAKNNVEEFYLVTDDIEELIAKMKVNEVKCSPVQRRSWGLLTKLKLPGGGNLKVYQPLHVRPKPAKVRGQKKLNDLQAISLLERSHVYCVPPRRNYRICWLSRAIARFASYG